MLNPAQAVARVIRNTFNFTGTAPRSEYWWWTLLQVIIALGFSFYTFSEVERLLPTSGYLGPTGEYVLDPNSELVSKINMLATGAQIYSLILFIPGLSLTIRRIRDAGHHWAWILVSLIPGIGGIILLIFLVQPSIAVVEARQDSYAPGKIMDRGRRTLEVPQYHNPQTSYPQTPPYQQQPAADNQHYNPYMEQYGGYTPPQQQQGGTFGVQQPARPKLPHELEEERKKRR